HLRATSNGRTENADVVEWEDVKFSIEELAALYKNKDPLLWYLTECFSASRKKGQVIVKKTRPYPIVCTSFFSTFFSLRSFLLQIQVGAISSFITSRNRYASGDLRLLLGLWLFACQAHIDVKRVFCRFGYAVSDSTTRNALTSLTDGSLNELKDKVQDATARARLNSGRFQIAFSGTHGLDR
ncbi:hypothetical protein B0H17DRAFT_939883, partial [Mycena rosella]